MGLLQEHPKRGTPASKRCIARRRCLVARYIGVGMRTYSSSGLVAATAIYVLVATAYLLVYIYRSRYEDIQQ
jgi:hypothetical protein